MPWRKLERCTVSQLLSRVLQAGSRGSGPEGGQAPSSLLTAQVSPLAAHGGAPCPAVFVLLCLCLCSRGSPAAAAGPPGGWGAVGTRAALPGPGGLLLSPDLTSALRGCLSLVLDRAPVFLSLLLPPLSGAVHLGESLVICAGASAGPVGSSAVQPPLTCKVVGRSRHCLCSDGEAGG